MEALSRLRYDAVAFGNHDLDFGVENAARLARAAAFPWVSANVTEAATGKAPAWLRPYVVLDEDGVRVGIVGMSPPDTPKLVAGADKSGLLFGPEVEAAQAAAQALEGKCDLLLFLTHLGPERDVRILAAVPRCPLVVGGHTHTRLSRPILAGPGKASWVVQAGTACVLAGRVRMRVSRATHEVALDDYELVPLAAERVGTDAATAAFLAERLRAVPALKALESPVGALAEDLSRVGASPGETSPAGNLLADAMRAGVPGADVALMNRGGIRVTLPKGPVTGRDLFLLMPFEDPLVEERLTGSELRAVIASSVHGSRVTPLEVSGLSATYRVEGEGPAAQVAFAAFEVGGAPLDDKKTYRVVVNAFLAKGGDGYDLLRRADARDTGVRVRDALTAFFAARPLTVPDRAPRLRPE